MKDNRAQQGGSVEGRGGVAFAILFAIAAALPTLLISVPALPQCEYEVTFIQAPEGPSGHAGTLGLGLSEAGDVVGYSIPFFGADQPFVWSEKDGFQSLPVLPGYDGGRALDVNSSGDVVGWMEPEDSPLHHATLWRDGEPIALGIPSGGNWSEAYAINESGQIVGEWGDSVDGDPTAKAAFTWIEGELIDLLPVFQTTYSSAMDINDLGQITGWFGDVWKEEHAYRLEDGVITDLGVIPDGQSAKARSLSELGWAVGHGILELPDGDSTGRHAFVYQPDSMIDIGTLPGNDWSLAYDLNNLGQVVGYCSKGLPNRGFLWQSGMMHEANTLTSPGSDVDISTLHAINNDGQIVGSASILGQGGGAVLLTPVRAPGDVDLNCTVDVLDLLAVVGQWGPCGDCPADLNHDEAVNVLDLLLVLRNWGHDRSMARVCLSPDRRRAGPTREEF